MESRTQRTIKREINKALLANYNLIDEFVSACREVIRHLHEEPINNQYIVDTLRIPMSHSCTCTTANDPNCPLHGYGT